MHPLSFPNEQIFITESFVQNLAIMQQVLALIFSVFIVASTLALPAPEAGINIGLPCNINIFYPGIPISGIPCQFRSGGLKEQMIDQVSTYLSE